MHDKHMVEVALAFLLVFTRISAVFTFLPFPGFRTGPDAARLLLSAAVAIALAPVWPHVTSLPAGGTFIFWMLQEICIGLTVGVLTSFLAEAAQIAAQMAGLQAGFSFASTIDPTTQADAGVLAVLTQLLGGLVFFGLGLHREVVLVFARSLELWPPGTVFLSPAAGQAVYRFGSSMFSVGLRLAMPVTALLLVVDVAFAVMGKLNAHLQMLSLAFPAKMLVGLAVFSITLTGLPLLFRSLAEDMFRILLHLLVH